MTMPSGATWIGGHLALNHPLAACCVCVAAGAAHYTATSETASPTVVLTLDDATSTQYSNAFRIAEEFGIKGTLYVPTQLVLDSKGTENDYHMTVDNLVEMKEAGWEIGAHTLGHENLLEIEPHEALVTMLGSKNQLVEMVPGIDDRVVTFSYPYGAYDQVIETFAWSMFEYSVNAWSDERGINIPETFENQNIHRFDVSNEDLAIEACEIITNLAPQETFVITMHGIVDDENPPLYTLSVSAYTDLLQCIVDAEQSGTGLTTKTLKEAADDLRFLREFGILYNFFEDDDQIATEQ